MNVDNSVRHRIWGGDGSFLHSRLCKGTGRPLPWFNLAFPRPRLTALLSSFHRRVAILALVFGLYLIQLNRALAQDHIDYRYEYYREEGDRIGVDTHSLLFEQKITPWLSVQGHGVYDAISGATPTGAPPAADIKTPFPYPGPLSTTVPLTFMHDKRWGGVFESIFTFGPHHITPQFSYSTESDYISYGGALNYSLDLNEKNTTLNLGWSHNWDTILPGNSPYIFSNHPKDTDDILVGLNQIFGPKTLVTANFTFRNSHGYLNDPYRGVLFDDAFQADLNNPILYPENRPDFRQSYIGFVSLLQYITPLHGAIEGSYRPYYDSFGIGSHTIDLSWHQKIGKRILISPLFRYYFQTAANFYATQFPGDPLNPMDPTPSPKYYSADYRLSKMETFTFGVELSGRVTDWLTLDLAYKRYDMRGLDGVTSQSAYPKANIVTIGARLWF
jgi:Protein of unknown function (DUF3570)